MLRLRKYRLILGTGAAILAIRVALRLVSLPRVLAWLTADPTAGRPDRRTLDDVAYYTDRWLDRFPYNPKGNCFPRSVMLYWAARRAGFPVQFTCGVMKIQQRLEGHAWLMLGEQDFLEPSSHWRSFSVTVRFPSTSPGAATSSLNHP